MVAVGVWASVRVIEAQNGDVIEMMMMGVIEMTMGGPAQKFIAEVFHPWLYTSSLSY